MINRKSESVKLLESIQITLKEGRNPPLTPKEINQIKSSLNDNFYKIFELKFNEYKDENWFTIFEKGKVDESGKGVGFIGYLYGVHYANFTDIGKYKGFFDQDCKANTWQEVIEWINNTVDAHVYMLPSTEEFKKYLNKRAIEKLIDVKVFNHNGWKYVQSSNEGVEKNGCFLDINPLASNELLITLLVDTDGYIKDTVNTWQEAAEWVNNKIIYYYGIKDKPQPKYNYDDEDDEENETLYDLVAVYDKNKKILFYKKFEVGEEEPYLLQFDEVKEAISFAENNPAAKVAILWDGIRDGESYDVEIWNNVEGDISDSPEDEKADYDYYTNETKKLLED